ncbi:SEFIR domain-containing protein [Luteibacter sp. 9135]|uniref:SEFIR domain-containing protein n=1 Tax=Luteibacter sp. 9135 TaxID=1500893 RepID=UPI0005619A29|nr:TIR domain-containing protein [Luteibacter sp. 9135]
MDAPKLFISYSWSSPDHEAWVIKLASDLVAEGIDVILDKWALKEGQDANAFMERMVNDPSVHKVAIISDETYAKKRMAAVAASGPRRRSSRPRSMGPLSRLSLSSSCLRSMRRA